ncbi:MAG: hypothetical protein K2K12_03975 [Clostridia bacterium]|nr:hypothetical protein [Clostridia bacterium]
MRFRNAMHITIDNFQNVFKLLLYYLVTGLLFGSLIYVILRLSLSTILESSQMSHVKDLIGEFFRALTSGNTEYLGNFQTNFEEAVKDLVHLVGNNGGAIAGAIAGVCIMYLLIRFVDGLAMFAVGSVINDRMSTFSRTPFSTAYFKNIGRAALYQLVYVPLCFLFDVLMGVACWFLFFYIPSLIPGQGIISVLIALLFTFTAVACLEALKMTLISSWMPAMIADRKKMGAAMKYSFTCKKEFGRRFSAFLVTVYIIAAGNVVFALCTFGSALLITVPLSFIFLLSMQFVNYYNLNGRKFFITYNKIVGGDEGPDGLSK